MMTATSPAPSAAIPADATDPRPPAAPARRWRLEFSGWAGLLLASPLIVMIALFVIYPVIRLVIDSVQDGRGLERYVDVFAYPVSRRALVTTLVDSIIVTLLTTVCGLAIAWTLHATRSRFIRSALWVVALVPMWMGVVVLNYTIYVLLSGNGPINAALLGLGIIGEQLPLLYNDGAVVFGMIYSLLPYAVLSLYASLSRIDLGLVTAAESLGASRARALASVAFPLGRGGVITTMSLLYVLSIGFYVTPMLLGGAQTPFMAIFIDDQMNVRFDYEGAAASAVVLLAVAVLVVVGVVAAVGPKTFRKALL
jgi:putative spermidine/putrescine transport system permease protein